MRQIIPLLALLCLILSCQKQEKLLPPKKIATLPPSDCDIQSYIYNGYDQILRHYKTYNPDHSIDSLTTGIYPISPWYFEGRVKYDSNRVYLLSNQVDTMFVAKLNSQHQVIETSYGENNPENFLDVARFTYNSAGQLTRIQRDSTNTDDIKLYYDTFGNLIQIASVKSPSTQVNFIYDYSTPIAASDYQIVPWFSVWSDLLLCKQLNLVDIHPRHKLLRATGNLYPPYDRIYLDQVIDAHGNVLSYHTSDYNGTGDNIYTFNLHCF